MNERGLKAAVRRRLRFIEFSLLWERNIGRKRLQEQFEISPQQATKDLTAYGDLCSGNMIYDARQKTYVPTSKFRPRFIKGDSDEYLLQLEMLIVGYRERDEVWLDTIPKADAVKISSRPIKREVLSIILEAIHEEVAIAARYVSLSSQSSSERRLKPHAIATDGHRWHMRAFDIDKDRHSDFVLSRVETARFIDAKTNSIPVDEAWDTLVPLILIVDDMLDERQRARLEYEYNMIDGQLHLSARQAMLFYYLRNYGFNPRPQNGKKMRNESSYKLKLKNFDEVEECLGRR